MLTCAGAGAFEGERFGGDEALEWAAMSHVGVLLGTAVGRDLEEVTGIHEFGAAYRVLVLAGTGHNGGDALLAAAEILEANPGSSVDVVAAGPDRMKPLARRALAELERTAEAADAADALKVFPWPLGDDDYVGDFRGYHLCLDGLLGFPFKPPLRGPCAEVVAWANARDDILLRASVDLPSGIGEERDAAAFRADFTYATGIAKAPLFDPANRAEVGRVRYLDAGFFNHPPPAGTEEENVRFLLPAILRPLNALRDPWTDKRDYGHALLLGGSRGMPGAILMAAQAAVRSGVGLVTVCAPESAVPAAAAACPEAMWVPWPELPSGGLDPAAIARLEPLLPRATALLVGPGMDAAEDGVLALLLAIAEQVHLPLVLDAGALRPEVIDEVARRPEDSGGVVITPHGGEFARVGGAEFDVGGNPALGGRQLTAFCRARRVTTVLKGPVTRVADAGGEWLRPAGGPVLARGGSGDLLAGLAVSLLARPGADPTLAACRAVVWHGLAAGALARARGAEAVRTTELLDHLSPVLRNLEDEL